MVGPQRAAIGSAPGQHFIAGDPTVVRAQLDGRQIQGLVEGEMIGGESAERGRNALVPLERRQKRQGEIPGRIAHLLMQFLLQLPNSGLLNGLLPIVVILASPAQHLILARPRIPLHQKLRRLAGPDHQGLGHIGPADGGRIRLAAQALLLQQEDQAGAMLHDRIGPDALHLRPIADDGLARFGPGGQAVQKIVGGLRRRPNALRRQIDRSPRRQQRGQPPPESLPARQVLQRAGFVARLRDGSQPAGEQRTVGIGHDVYSENRTQMSQKKLIFADKKDKIRIICENLRVSDVSAFYFQR